MSGAGNRWRIEAKAYGLLGPQVHLWEGDRYLGSMEPAVAASVVADHDARLDAEPVGWQWALIEEGPWFFSTQRDDSKYSYWRPLYTHPPDATAELATQRADIARVTAERDEAQERYNAAQEHYIAIKGTYHALLAATGCENGAELQEKAARATAAEAALVTAKRDAWIAAQTACFTAIDKLADHAAHQAKNGGVPADFWQMRADWLNEASAAIRALTPPAEAEGGRQDD